MNEVANADLGHEVYRSHTVLIVDNSGSMRKSDVSGHASRTSAVYDCLIQEFVRPQMESIKNNSKQEIEAVATLISINDDAQVIFERQPFGQAMVDTMEVLMHSRARSHGNYLPALDKAMKVLQADAGFGAQLFIVFLSDGAPSDHIYRHCTHGIQIWQDDCNKLSIFGRFPLQVCENPQTAKECRREIMESVHDECVEKIGRLGDLFGRDRTYIGTVAFGPPSEDYRVLRDMAAKLPRNSFQKLGLNAMSLKTAFSSLTSNLTDLNTQMTGGGLTVRKVKKQEAGTQFRDLTWDIYKTMDTTWTLYGKHRWDTSTRALSMTTLATGVVGVACSKDWKAKGAERYVHQCVEVDAQNEKIGQVFVAKWPVHEESLGLEFPKRFCRMQARAEGLATEFNTKVLRMVRTLHPEWQVHFLQCAVYFVRDTRYSTGTSYILGENELVHTSTSSHVSLIKPNKFNPPPTHHSPYFSPNSLPNTHQGGCFHEVEQQWRHNTRRGSATR